MTLWLMLFGGSGLFCGCIIGTIFWFVHGRCLIGTIFSFVHSRGKSPSQRARVPPAILLATQKLDKKE